MQALVTLWGLRLTYNFARKGGYSLSSEDYRWPILKKKLTPLQFELLNVSFISFYQNALLLMITLPAYVAWRARGTPLNTIDALAALLFLTLWIGETVADQQQWSFQTLKHALIAKKVRLPAGDLSNGFITSGLFQCLFQYSRHPNFFCEISLW
jgi:steroid 5-alpha reductase family enzyme